MVFTGALYGAELAEQFREADLSSRLAPAGYASAARLRTPLIAAEADGTGDLVRPENGWQIPPDDLPALGAALSTALRDIPMLRKMGAESYRIVSEEINLEKMVAVFIEALKRSLP